VSSPNLLVNLQVFDSPAQLASPAIPLADLFAKKLILFRIEVARGARWRSLLIIHEDACLTADCLYLFSIAGSSKLVSFTYSPGSTICRKLLSD
jgi:hypothetical protein